MDFIRIRGARTHNLKNVDLDLPRNRLIVITGPSGSGKSSLAFDTLYAEGQRRYVESLSAYARQFLALTDKPDVDAIEGLSPAIAIEQKTASHNPRSTVGTVTEIHDHLRLLYARAGTPHCPEHGHALDAQTVAQMVDAVLARPEGERLLLLAPIVRERKGEHAQLFTELRAGGFLRVRIDATVHELDALPALDGKTRHTIEVVVDRLRVRSDQRARLAESFETALKLADGLARVESLDADGEALAFSARHACPECGFTVPELEPRLFSFNSPAGACPACDGLGTQNWFDPARVVVEPGRSLADGAIRGWERRNPWSWALLQALAAHYGFDPEQPFRELPAAAREVVLYGSGTTELDVQHEGERGARTQRQRFEGVIPNLERRYRETESATVREELARLQAERVCPACRGARLNPAARAVRVGGRSLPEIAALPIDACREWFLKLDLPGRHGVIATPILRELRSRLGFLGDVGLDYLSLDRAAETLSGGEAQRIRLASQIGAGLVGVLYVLDEPSIGLHPRDIERLLKTLMHLRDLGNTVVVVEHDEATIRAADHIVDMGPAAGVQGGRVVAKGTPHAISAHPDSLTGEYLSGRRRIEPGKPRFPDGRWLTVRGATGNNLKDIDAAFPVGLFTCVTGVSGSGKSTLVNDTLLRALLRHLHGSRETPAPHRAIEGLAHFDKVIAIDQSPIGRTPRSNPATYTGLFGPIRELYAGVPEARARGYGPGRFSFNVKGGRCEACQGDGLIRGEMHFLPDVYVPCDICHGRRYERETLEVKYKGRSIADTLDLTVDAARPVFAAVPAIARKLDTLAEVGLGYLRLGQSATTLSGGEAQRVKLAKELARRDTGRTLYILDEPTTGLHFQDVAQLLAVLLRLRDDGNTVVVIEHDLDVIRCADWIVDLGPEGGGAGGRIVVSGSAKQVSHSCLGHTACWLRQVARVSS
ncbi:MAG: excinuclease ABC subunit UvrA [Proteobacteria bacterium]|nr:excinuclease ABC subunit UvrA [Pseudomonadota bacterium]